MAETYRLGPAKVFAASAITDPVESWVDLGDTRGDIAVRIEGGGIATGKVDQSGMTPRADAVWRVGQRVIASVPFLDKSVTKLKEYFPGAVVTTASGETAMGAGNGTSRLAPKAFALVPVDEYTVGSPWWDSEFVVWIPEGIARVIGPWPYSLPEGDDASKVSEVEFATLKDDSLPNGLQDAGGLGRIHRLLGSGNVGPLAIDFLWEAEDGLNPKAGSAGTFANTSADRAYRNAGGVMQKAGAAVLRNGHYESGVRTCLLEGQRTNGWTYSEDFTQAAWTKKQLQPFGSGSVADATTAPDGTATADLLVENAVADNHGVERAAPATTDNTLQSVTVFVKPAGRNWIRILTQDKAGNLKSTYFNISTGVLGTVASGHTARIESWANGWYRCEVVWSSLSGGSTPLAFIYMATGDGGTGYTGDGVSGVYIWGAQFEADAPFASSYIKTTSTTVTRLADQLSFSLPALVSSPQEMTVRTKHVERGTVQMPGATRFWYIGSGTGANPRAYLAANGSNRHEIGHHNATALVYASDTLGAPPSIGHTVETRSVFAGSGAVSIGVSVNAAAEAVSAPSGANAFLVWSSATLHLNGVLGSGTGFVACQQVVVTRRTRTLTELRAA